MSFVITPESIKCFQFPDDAVEGRAEFVNKFQDPHETWLRAYGFTMVDLVDDIIAAVKMGVPVHVFLDHSQAVGHVEHPLAQKLVDGGVETTVGTSYAGSKYIMHQKGFVTADADCWEGSVNFSTTGWLQVNSALHFNDPDWRDHFIASFNTDLAYAWDKEAHMQLMKKRPAVATA